MTSTQGIVCRWNLDKITPREIQQATDQLIRDTMNAYDKIASVPINNVNYNNVIKALMDVERDNTNREGPLDFGQHCSPSKEVRKASVEAAKRINDAAVEISMRKDVFDRVVAFKDNVGYEGLSEEQKRFVEKEIVKGKRNGFHLPEKTRGEITTVKKSISQLATQYSYNLNEDDTTLTFTREELAGVPDDLVDSFDKVGENRLRVTMKYPHFFPITRKCSVPETRRRMEVAYQSRCKLETLVHL